MDLQNMLLNFPIILSGNSHLTIIRLKFNEIIPKYSWIHHISSATIEANTNKH